MAELSEKDLREIKQELESIKSVAMIKWPLFASLLRKCRIVIDPDVETAGVDIENVMAINPDFFGKLSEKAKIYTYGHEVMHIGFCHCQREGDKIHWIYNWAADNLINHLLSTHGFKDVKFPIELVTPEKIAPLIGKEEKEVAKMSMETLYYLLEKNLKDKKPPLNIMNDLLKKKGGDSKSGSSSRNSGGNSNNQENRNKGQINNGSEKQDGRKVIQEGDPDGYKDGMTPEEREKYWKDALVKAVMHAKLAGRLPADAQLIINELLGAKVDWKSIIKKMILNGFGRNVISTWKKSSRRHPLLPGNTQLTKPNLYLLIDTSLSTYSMMPQFLGEVYSIIKNQGRGIIYPWDAAAYDPIELKKAVDLAQAIKEKKIKGGGGTVIAPVLQLVLKSLEQEDIVVVITDGAIFDLKEKTTQELLRKVALKSSQPIFGSVDVGAVPSGWQKVKIELGTRA